MLVWHRPWSPIQTTYGFAARPIADRACLVSVCLTLDVCRVGPCHVYDFLVISTKTTASIEDIVENTHDALGARIV